MVCTCKPVLPWEGMPIMRQQMPHVTPKPTLPHVNCAQVYHTLS